MSLRAGLIGLGVMGRHHARLLSSLDGVELVAVADPAGDPQGLLTNTAVLRDVDALIDSGIDYCVVAAPTAFHEEVGLRLAGAGVHALIEKPLAIETGAAQRLARAFQDAGLVGAVVLVWLAIPVLAASPGWVSRQTTGSFVARTIDGMLPPPPDAMQALRAVVGEDAAPEVFDALRPTESAGPPPATTGLDGTVTATTARSVVKVEGTACSKVQDGTGWVAGEGLVVTNAHVVAGERTTSVIRDDGRRFDATVVRFDPDRDLAVLRVAALDRAALVLAGSDPTPRSTGGVFGHPGGAPLRIAPFSVARLIDATGRDIYGADRTDRRVLELAAALRPGDSGSALVDPEGAVVGVAFAIARDRSDVAYALAPSEVRVVLDGAGDAPVTTGPCLA